MWQVSTRPDALDLSVLPLRCFWTACPPPAARLPCPTISISLLSLFRESASLRVVHASQHRGLPLVVAAFLLASHPYATARRFKFLLEGLRDVQRELRHQVGMHAARDRRRKHGPAVLRVITLC